MKKFSSILLVLISLITTLNMIDFPWEIRFVDPSSNYLFVMVLAVLIPISTFLWSAFREGTFNKVFSFIVSFCLLLPCYLVFTVAGLDYADIRKEGVDSSFEEINKIQVNENNYILYRTNGGATTSFGLVLRVEKEVTANLKVVNVIYSKYKASDSTLKLVDNEKIEMRIQPYSKGGKVEVVTLSL